MGSEMCIRDRAGARARTSDLNKTVSLATLQSAEAIESLASSGVFTSNGEMFNLAVSGVAPAAVTPAITPPAGAASAAAARMGRKKTAVIADDHVPDLGVLAGLLGAAGYAIRATATRKQFIDELNEPIPPDVIFLKFESTTIDALKTVDKIRQHPALTRIPVVVSGESPSREDIAKSILLGASGWIVRPYTEDKVKAALHGALSGVQ